MSPASVSGDLFAAASGLRGLDPVLKKTLTTGSIGGHGKNPLPVFEKHIISLFQTIY
jgi:hypothetical protein